MCALFTRFLRAKYSTQQVKKFDGLYRQILMAGRTEYTGIIGNEADIIRT